LIEEENSIQKKCILNEKELRKNEEGTWK